MGGQWTGTAKSVESLVEKVIRKRKAGREYDAYSAKDHARGTVQIARWDQASEAIQKLGDQGFAVEVTVEEPLNQFGYRGINANISLGDRINGEIQIHTPESWALKKETDKIYRKWRDVIDQPENSLSPGQDQEAKRDIAYCRKVWDDYWAAVAPEVKASISEAGKGLASNMAPSATSPASGRQVPSSRTSQPTSSRDRMTRPSSMRANNSDIVDTSKQSITETVAGANTETLETALNDLSLEALLDRAKRIGVTVKGKKAQLAALIAEAIRAKVAGKQTRTERAALAETEAAIADHPLYQEYDHADVTTHRIKIDPDAVYFVEPRYRGDVEGYIGKPGSKDYNAAVGRHITSASRCR